MRRFANRFIIQKLVNDVLRRRGKDEDCTYNSKTFTFRRRIIEEEKHFMYTCSFSPQLGKITRLFEVMFGEMPKSTLPRLHQWLAFPRLLSSVFQSSLPNTSFHTAIHGMLQCFQEPAEQHSSWSTCPLTSTCGASSMLPTLTAPGGSQTHFLPKRRRSIGGTN